MQVLVEHTPQHRIAVDLNAVTARKHSHRRTSQKLTTTQILMHTKRCTTNSPRNLLKLHPDCLSPPSPSNTRARPPAFSHDLTSRNSASVNGSRDPPNTSSWASSNLSRDTSSLFLQRTKDRGKEARWDYSKIFAYAEEHRKLSHVETLKLDLNRRSSFLKPLLGLWDSLFVALKTMDLWGMNIDNISNSAQVKSKRLNLADLPLIIGHIIDVYSAIDR